MENNTFTYRYSAHGNAEVERIRQRYLPHEESKSERLRRLDRKARNAGVIQSLTLGIMGSLVFGVGLCFGLNVLQGAPWLPLVLMAGGTLLMIPAYPVYKCISRRTKKRLTPEILRLSEEILGI